MATLCWQQSAIVASQDSPRSCICARKELTSLLLGAGNGHTEAAGKRERGRAMGRPVLAAAPPAGGAEEEGGGASTAPLSAVVSNAVRRWFIDAHKEAIRGDVVRSSNPPQSPGQTDASSEHWAARLAPQTCSAVTYGTCACSCSEHAFTCRAAQPAT